MFTNVFNIIHKNTFNSIFELCIITLGWLLLTKINILSISSDHDIKAALVIRMKLNNNIWCEPNVSFTIQSISLSFSIQILNTLTWRYVEIGKQCRNISIMTTDDCHFCCVSVQKSNSILTFIDNFFQFVSVN